MYYPYLRGKQFELIALRELSDKMSTESSKISPIIEPVKNSSTFKTTIKVLKNNNINFNIIINPSVGDLMNSTEEIINNLKNEINDYDNFQLAIIIEEKTNINKYISELKSIKFGYSGITLIHKSIKTDIEKIISNLNKISTVINNIIYFNKTSRRYYREFEPNTRVGLDDFFVIRSKNSDYLHIEDSAFSEEHLYYKEDNFKGFSDFLTIGDNYSESGFLPYAVAIHVSYLDEENRIRIRHFVSDSNFDNSDIGGKFAEALEKLVTWCNEKKLNSIALNEFRKLQSTGHFPGLGSIKKLSIMHHIELVLKLI